MNIVYYSNCQFRGIDYFLKKIYHDIKTFHISNYELITNQKVIPVDIIKNADVFIYQPIDKKHGIYSTNSDIENNIMSYLHPKCKTISFPYIYNSALWILIPPAIIDSNIGGYGKKSEYINSYSIDKFRLEGYSLEQILKLFSQNQIDFDYENRFNKSIETLKKKEELCDVKISEFIVQNIRKHRLFLTQNHPTTCVFVHCVNQILSLLDTNYKYDEFAYPDNVVELPGEWPHTSYDIAYWNFEYRVSNISNKWYEKHIINIYNKTINKS